MLRENKALLEKFIERKRLEKDIVENTQLKYENNFTRFERMLPKPKPFNKLAQSEVNKAVLQAKDSGKWGAGTIDTTATVMNTFWKVFGVKVHIKRNKKKNGTLPADLLTEEEVLKFIDAAEHARDKALIATLYESGCRAGELLGMQIKDVSFDDKLGGTVVFMTGKTGKRRLLLVFSTPYIKVWLNRHPLKADRDAALWVGIGNRSKHEPLEYDMLNFMLKKLGKKCEIKKPVNPHHFRHSRASYLAKFLTEQQLKVYLGWTQGSAMASTYVHLSGADVDDALLKIFGLKKITEGGTTKLLHKVCLRCKEPNQAEHTFCQKCGFPLEAGATEDYEKKIRAKEEDYEQILGRVRKIERLVLPAKAK
jgi:site-specific recombinase XerD/ribosomal protein L40E